MLPQGWRFSSHFFKKVGDATKVGKLKDSYPHKTGLDPSLFDIKDEIPSLITINTIYTNTKTKLAQLSILQQRTEKVHDRNNGNGKRFSDINGRVKSSNIRSFPRFHGG